MLKRKIVSGREESIQSMMRSSHRFTIDSPSLFLSQSSISYLFCFAPLSFFLSFSVPFVPPFTWLLPNLLFSSPLSSLSHLLAHQEAESARISSRSATRLRYFWLFASAGGFRFVRMKFSRFSSAVFFEQQRCHDVTLKRTCADMVL